MRVAASDRPDMRPLVTHRYKLNEIEKAYDLFATQRDGALKVAAAPQAQLRTLVLLKLLRS